MSEKEIYAKIVEIIQEHDSSKLHVTPELNLKEELGEDSVDEDMDNFKTISDVVAYIHEKLKKQH